MKAILFDAGNTLVLLEPASAVQLHREADVQVSEEALMGAECETELLPGEMVRRDADDAKRGRASFAEIFRRLGVPDRLLPAAPQRLYPLHAEGA